MFICFPWKFTIRHLLPASPSLGDLCAEPHLINGMVCFTQTLICQREVVQLSWGKKLAAAFQHQTEVFSLKGISWGLDIFSCPVNPFSGLFILCTALTIFFYPAPCEQPSASSCSVSPVWSPTGIWVGSGMIVQAAFSVLVSRADAELLFSCLWNYRGKRGRTIQSVVMMPNIEVWWWWVSFSDYKQVTSFHDARIMSLKF